MHRIHNEAQIRCFATRGKLELENHRRGMQNAGGGVDLMKQLAHVIRAFRHRRQGISRSGRSSSAIVGVSAAARRRLHDIEGSILWEGNQRPLQLSKMRRHILDLRSCGWSYGFAGKTDSR